MSFMQTKVAAIHLQKKKNNKKNRRNFERIYQFFTAKIFIYCKLQVYQMLYIK